MLWQLQLSTEQVLLSKIDRPFACYWTADKQTTPGQCQVLKTSDSDAYVKLSLTSADLLSLQRKRLFLLCDRMTGCTVLTQLVLLAQLVYLTHFCILSQHARMTQ